MLTYAQAKKIGVNACLDKLGRDFVRRYENTSCAGYGEEDEYAFCYAGVDDRTELPEENTDIILDDGKGTKFPYLASCNVWYEDGRIDFLDCVLPEASG